MSTVLDTFEGDVLRRGAAGYESVSGSLLAPGSPVFVLLPSCVADVQAAVRFAAEEGLVLSVRGGGHAFAGFGTNDGGIVIDLSRLSTVELVDEAQHLVRVGGGATSGQVAMGLAPHGLALSTGDTESVGIGGLTLIGGIGWKARKHGLALDQLIGADVVLADGRVVHASARENRELFWAIRGGGGNFGIVTTFEFVAHPTTDVYYGRIAFPAAEAARVMQGWADYLRVAPDELTSAVMLANTPADGHYARVEVDVVFDGDDPELAADALRPIRRLGTVIHDDVTRTPYANTLANSASPPPGTRFVARSAFVERDDVPAVLQVLAETVGGNRAPAIGVRSVSGAVSRVPNDATAYAHRRAELMIVTLTAGPEHVVQGAAPALDAMWTRLAPHVNGAYANFLSAATEVDVAAVYPADTRRRLATVKRRYDPGNLFARNHNVPPSTGEPDGAASSRRGAREELTLDPELRRVLDGTSIAHLASVLPDGAPHSVPVWIGTHGDRVAIATAPDSVKARNLRCDPRVAFSLTPPNDPLHPVVVRGRVVDWLDGDTAWSVVDEISTKYIGEPFPRRARRVVALIEPDRQTAS